MMAMMMAVALRGFVGTSWSVWRDQLPARRHSYESGIMDGNDPCGMYAIFAGKQDVVRRGHGEIFWQEYGIETQTIALQTVRRDQSVHAQRFYLHTTT